MNYLKKKKISNPTRLSKVKKCYWTAAGAAALCLCCVTPAMAAGHISVILLFQTPKALVRFSTIQLLSK